jgi:hypothetical protein
VTFTYRCELPGSANCSGGVQKISCMLPPDTPITFGSCGRSENSVGDGTAAEWAKSWDAALSSLREVVDALK